MLHVLPHVFLYVIANVCPKESLDLLHAKARSWRLRLKPPGTGRRALAASLLPFQYKGCPDRMYTLKARERAAKSRKQNTQFGRT